MKLAIYRRKLPKMSSPWFASGPFSNSWVWKNRLGHCPSWYWDPGSPQSRGRSGLHRHRRCVGLRHRHRVAGGALRRRGSGRRRRRRRRRQWRSGDARSFVRRHSLGYRWTKGRQDPSCRRLSTRNWMVAAHHCCSSSSYAPSLTHGGRSNSSKFKFMGCLKTAIHPACSAHFTWEYLRGSSGER